VFERSEFSERGKCRGTQGIGRQADVISGWPFLWSLSFGHAKESDSQPTDWNWKTVAQERLR
jgi:hypothetical protein